jgi:hypothetical protein
MDKKLNRLIFLMGFFLPPRNQNLCQGCGSTDTSLIGKMVNFKITSSTDFSVAGEML